MRSGESLQDKHYESWYRRGIWTFILVTLRANCDNERVMIDVTIVCAHPCAAGYECNQNEREALGCIKVGFTKKYMRLLML